MSDGLIQVPEQSTAGGAARVVVALFLLVLVGTAAVDTLFPAVRPEPAGAEKELEDRRRARAQLGDGSMAKLVEHELRLSSRVRDVVGGAYSGVLFRTLGEAKGRVLLGRDHWLFLKSRLDPPDIPDRVWPALPAAYMAAFQRRLAALGMSFALAPIPRKSVLHPDVLPRGVRPHEWIDESFQAEMRLRGVTLADLFREYENAVGPLYSKTDSHWTQEAQFLAARAICKKIGAILVPGDRSTKIIKTDRPAEAPRHDLYEYIDVRLSDDEMAALRISDAPAFLIHDKTGGPTQFEPLEEMQRIAVIGTSFTARRKLVHYMEHFSGERIWNGAKEAMPLFGSAYHFLLEHPEARPEVFVLEMPISQIMGESELWQMHAARIFAEFPPGEYEQLADLEVSGQWTLGSTDQELIGSVPLGRAANSGDGVVSVRLVGSCTGDLVQLELNNGVNRIPFEWQPGRTELILPWIASEPVCEPLGLRAKSAGVSELSVESVELVAEIDLRRRRDLLAREPEQREGRWVRSFEPPEGLRVPRLTTWVVQLEGTFEEPVPMSVFADSADESRGRLEIDFRGVRSDGWILLNLGRFEGAEMRTLEISGEGEPPEARARFAFPLRNR